MLKRLIEVALPLKEVSEQSAREKSIRHGHISTLHIWWARRYVRAEKAKKFGLAGVEVVEADDDLWMPIWELHERCQRYVQSKTLAKYVAARNGGINVQAQAVQIS